MTLIGVHLIPKLIVRQAAVEHFLIKAEVRKTLQRPRIAA